MSKPAAPEACDLDFLIAGGMTDLEEERERERERELAEGVVVGVRTIGG
jgi:hypothetical protein